MLAGSLQGIITQALIPTADHQDASRRRDPAPRRRDENLIRREGRADLLDHADLDRPRDDDDGAVARQPRPAPPDHARCGTGRFEPQSSSSTACSSGRLRRRLDHPGAAARGPQGRRELTMTDGEKPTSIWKERDLVPAQAGRDPRGRGPCGVRLQFDLEEGDLAAQARERPGAAGRPRRSRNSRPSPRCCRRCTELLDACNRGPLDPGPARAGAAPTPQIHARSSTTGSRSRSRKSPSRRRARDAGLARPGRRRAGRDRARRPRARGRGAAAPGARDPDPLGAHPRAGAGARSPSSTSISTSRPRCCRSSRPSRLARRAAHAPSSSRPSRPTLRPGSNRSRRCRLQEAAVAEADAAGRKGPQGAEAQAERQSASRRRSPPPRTRARCVLQARPLLQARPKNGTQARP